jgi:hypothetical protein
LLYDEAGNIKASMQQLMDQAFQRILENSVPVNEYITLRLDNPENALYFHTQNPSIPRVRLGAVLFQRTQICVGQKVGGLHLTHLLQLVTGDKRFFVAENGHVYQAGENAAIHFVFESAGPNGIDVLVDVLIKLPDPLRT